jgi:hypothetical protein
MGVFLMLHYFYDNEAGYFHTLCNFFLSTFHAKGLISAQGYPYKTRSLGGAIHSLSDKNPLLKT